MNATGALPSRAWSAARALLAAHVTLIVFATAAMVTILAGEFPAWMQGPYTPKVFEIAWKYTGQVYVVLGLLAALVHAGPRFGWQRSIVVFALASAVALASELGGTNIGVPFGPYRYTDMLGYRIAGDVPYPIPLSWSYMLYCALAICARLLSLPATERGRWGWAALAGLLLVAWDVPLEVHMTNVPPPHWVWELEKMPAWVPGWLGAGVFHGMPLTNWVGWFVTATLIARLMLAIVPAAEWRHWTAASAFPLVLFAANGLMPIAAIARHGYWGAAVLGLLAMGVPLLLCLRRGQAQTAPVPDSRGAGA